jgi:hypothetical protein
VSVLIQRRSGGERAKKRRSIGSRIAQTLALLILCALIVIGWMQYRDRQRLAELWRRVGSCEAVGDSPRVVCSGVRLTTITLPESFNICRRLNPCVAKVNVEAAPAFRGALREIVQQGVGAQITDFGTVNRRRCKDARTGEFLANCISKHSYGIAVDVRSFADNANWKAVVRQEPEVLDVVRIFRSYGFRWGGTFQNNFDPQHFEWEPK